MRSIIIPVLATVALSQASGIHYFPCIKVSLSMQLSHLINLLRSVQSVPGTMRTRKRQQHLQSYHRVRSLESLAAPDGKTGIVLATPKRSVRLDTRHFVCKVSKSVAQATSRSAPWYDNKGRDLRGSSICCGLYQVCCDYLAPNSESFPLASIPALNVARFRAIALLTVCRWTPRCPLCSRHNRLLRWHPRR